MLRVGTDCSGIEAPIVALKELGVPISHEFSSETDSNCVKMIQANFAPKLLFGDIQKRDIRQVPDIDLYVCGFPCQPFSSLRAVNLADKTKRDTRKGMVNKCYDVIEKKKPIVYVLENVPALLSANGGKTFKAIMKRLHGSGEYNVYYQVLNTKDYGIPQNRQRLYIVGIKINHLVKEFHFPKVVPLTVTVEDFLQDKTKYKFSPNTYSWRLQERLPKDHARRVYCVKWRGGEGTSEKYTPCITTSTDIFVTKYNRNLTPKEKFLLQGFPKKMKIVVSDAVLGKQAGNAMSVNVLKYLFVEIFKALGYYR